ncbi:N6-adenosine-specific RNA methylase IME4 [Leifsonia sp. 563]|uniref:MT-A70 family methyltransferase n=1 Tax=Leifsonia sp. 563 TaxID=3156412 RepID=UPI0033972190
MTSIVEPTRARQRTIAPLRQEQAPPPLPTVEGGFKTVYADPPWQFQNRTGKVAPEHRRLDRYSTMTLDSIKALPVADHVAKNAHLYLWVPNALLPDGLAVMESWGFRYISNIIWAKRRKDGGPDGRGVGFYFRNVTEILLFGVRGSMRTLAPARSQVNMVETRKREHSRKPDEFYPLIEACSPGPFLEMFARRAQPGWHVFGDEAPDEVDPRGREQKGYSGGEIDRAWLPDQAPKLAPHQRIDGEAADELAKLVRAFYDSGQSIRDIASTTGYSIQRVRTLLQHAGADLRARGGTHG